MIGRRIADGEFTFTGQRAGDYGFDDEGRLWAMTPAGELMHVDKRWGIETHDDGTISVVPASPGESYSIRQAGRVSWHGYLTRGEWITCDDSEFKP